MNIYLTQDQIGARTGGGIVTSNEYHALEKMGEEVHPLDRARINAPGTPFELDSRFSSVVSFHAKGAKLTQIYSGCFTKTVEGLKGMGSKVSYTAAAHDINESRREFEELGIPFDFPHLVDPGLWDKYVGGYRNADLVICPSTVSAKIMKSYGCSNVVVVPHGCDLPGEIAPPPKRFTVGYLGQAGPDKGLRYLFAAWKHLDMKDGMLLVGGRDPWIAMDMWRRFGGGCVQFTGFVDNVSDFYNNISVYVQPSVSEGFGIEVLEAFAHERPALVSDGAGAVDLAGDGSFPRRDVDALCEKILLLRNDQPLYERVAKASRQVAEDHTWDKIQDKYCEAWKALMEKK